MNKISLALLGVVTAVLLVSGNAFAYQCSPGEVWTLNAVTNPDELLLVEQESENNDLNLIEKFDDYHLDGDEWVSTISGNDWFTVTVNEDGLGGTLTVKDGVLAGTYYMAVKADSGLKIYEILVSGSSDDGVSCSIAWDTSGITKGEDDRNPNGYQVSHISIYSDVPIPAAAWLLGSGLLGLVGVERWRRRRS